jgi:putative transposase
MSKQKRAFKTELELNNVQRSACARHAGAARFAYNWGLAEKQAARERGQSVPSAIDLHRKLNQLKAGELAWMYEVSKCAPQEALRDLDSAFKHFFRRCKVGARKKGHPRFKSKKKGLGGFRLTGAIHIDADHIQLPRLGRLKLKEKGYLPVGARVSQATVRERAGHWTVSVLVEIDAPEPVTDAGKPVIGVDLGVKTLATVSTGERIENPRSQARYARKLSRAQRVLSRRQKGSARRRAAKQALARIHRRIANIRQDTLHKLSTRLTRNASVIVLEDLSVSGMLANHHLAGAVSDAAFHEFRRQVTYKCKWRGVELIVAPRFYPSSKTCSTCGRVKETLSLSERIYECQACGGQIDRDLNAALNLAHFARSSREKTNGRGGGSADGSGNTAVKLLPMKRQPNAR